MGLFRRRAANSGTLLSAASLNALAVFGQNHFNGHDPDPSATFEMFLRPGVEAARSDPERLVREICGAARRAGGWALVGGDRLVMELIGGRCTDADYLALLDDALLFLQSQGISSAHLNRYEADRWIEMHGTLRTFIGYDLSEVPHEGKDPNVQELSVGESRRVAQLWPRADSNAIYVERRSRELFVAVVEAPRSDEDPERVRSDWFAQSSLVGLLRDLGERMVTPPHWAHADLKPYFPWQPPQSQGASE